MGIINRDKVAKKEEVKEPTKEIRVVEKLPTQEVREYNDEKENKIITFLTRDEAMEMLLNQEEK